MVKQNPKERRQHLRAKRILSIQYRLVKGRGRQAERTWRLSTTQDMSVFGLAFLSEVSYVMGDVLEIKVVMSGILDIYSGLAKVVRIESKKTAAYDLVAVRLMGSKARTRHARNYTKPNKNRIIKISNKK
jgi:hypothetical protein